MLSSFVHDVYLILHLFSHTEYGWCLFWKATSQLINSKTLFVNFQLTIRINLEHCKIDGRSNIMSSTIRFSNLSHFSCFLTSSLPFSYFYSHINKVIFVWYPGLFSVFHHPTFYLSLFCCFFFILLLSLLLLFYSFAFADGFPLESQWQQVSRTLLSILANLNNAFVWIVPTHPLISKSSSPCTNPLVTVPS